MRGWQHALATVILTTIIMGSVTLYEEGRVGAFPVTYETVRSEVLRESFTLDEGHTKGLGFTVTTANLTEVTIHLTWGDDVGAADTVRLRLVAPNGTAWATSGTGQALHLEARPQTAPPDHVVHAVNAEAAPMLVYPAAGDPGLVGDWRVEVTLVAAPGSEGTSGTGLDDTVDGTETFAIDATIGRFEPRIGPAL